MLFLITVVLQNLMFFQENGFLEDETSAPLLFVD